MAYCGYSLNFGHVNIMKYCNRPFQTVEEMNETMINNWNNVIKDKDEVYHLGDFSLVKKENLRKIRIRLRGKVYLIKGNHDKFSKKDYENFENVEKIKEIRYNGKKIVLCHYAMRTWNCSHHGAYHFYGHSHGTLEPYGRSCDVGVDVHNFRPLHIDEAIRIADENYKLER